MRAISREGENDDWHEARLAADAEVALGKGQAVQLSERGRHGGQIASEHGDVAGPKLHCAQTAGEVISFG